MAAQTLPYDRYQEMVYMILEDNGLYTIGDRSKYIVSDYNTDVHFAVCAYSLLIAYGLVALF